MPATADNTIRMIGDNFFFCILLIIVIAASKIKRPTPTLIPLNAFATIVISKKLSKNIEIKKITIKDGTTILYH